MTDTAGWPNVGPKCSTGPVPGPGVTSHESEYPIASAPTMPANCFPLETGTISLLDIAAAQLP